jgi:hypothetical protein
MSLTENELARSILAEDHIGELEVWCHYRFCLDNSIEATSSSTTANNNNNNRLSPQRFIYPRWVEDADGCQFHDRYARIAQHEAACPFAWVNCRYGGNICNVRLRDLESHQEQCQFRPWQCPHCAMPVEKQLLDRHTDVECEKFPVQCALCGANVPRSELNHEHKAICPQQPVPCTFAVEGCPKKEVKREKKRERKRKKKYNSPPTHQLTPAQTLRPGYTSC